MNTVPTIRFATQAQSDISRISAELADLQRQMGSSSQVEDLKSLGDGSTRLISTSGLIRQDEHRITLAQELEARMQVQATSMQQASSGVTQLVRTLREAALNKDGGNVTTGIEFGFANLTQAMNQTLNGVPLFGGERVGDPPVEANSLSDLIAITAPDQLFDEAARSPRVDLGSGIAFDIAERASDISWPTYEALRDLKIYLDANPSALSPQMTQTDSEALLGFAKTIEDAVGQIRNAESRNGFKLQRVESTRAQLEDRVLSLQNELTAQSDSNLATVATRLSALRTQYEATGQTFAQLSELSLLSFLR